MTLPENMQEILEKHPLPWRKEGTRIYASDERYVANAIILALVNALAPEPERERYYVYHVQHPTEFFNWEVHDRTRNYGLAVRSKFKDEVDAEAEAARLNAEQFIDRRDSMALAEKAAHRNAAAESAPPEPELPERPWLVNEHVGLSCVEIVRDFTGGDGFPRTACLLRLDRARGSSSVSDAQWQRQKGYIRHAIRCVNAELHHERVEDMAGVLARCVWESDVTLPNYPARALARDLKTEVEKTDGSNSE